MRIYLASPLGFAISTRHYLLELEKALAVTDATVINPWDNFEQTRAFNSAKAILDRDARLAALAEINREIGRTNEMSIRSCDVLIAVLDGPDVDSGTASEIGFACALGKRVHGLRTDMRLAGDNEASVVNLQVQYFIEASGGRIVRTAEALVSLISASNTSAAG